MPLLTPVNNRELDSELQQPIIMIYLNKIKQRQIFEAQAFEQIMNHVNTPELLVQMLNDYICRAIAYSASHTQVYPPTHVQQNPNVISNLRIEAQMNVYDRQGVLEQAQGRFPWHQPNYLRKGQKNVTHVWIAYFINRQITQEENKDPLEYFEHYRQANNE